MASPTGRLVIPAVARFVQPGTVAPRASRAKLDVMFVARVRSLALLSALTCACGRVGVVGPWTFMLAPDDSAEGAFMAAFAA